VEICFVPSGNHVDVVRSRRPEVAAAGVIREKDGTVLGSHDGIDRFTVGQRKGLGVAAGKKRFVLEVIPATREVVVGDAEDLLATGLTASVVNWLIDPPAGLECVAKVRYRHAGSPATVTATDGGGAVVRFRELVSAVTPGQAVTFYQGTRVLGGGWIESATRA
jgi:tRNA-specific 2-thiouridylase